MSVLVCLFLLSLLLVGCGQSTNNETDSEGTDGEAQIEYPTKNINGVIMWGSGGATDNVARGVAPIVEEHLGTSLVMTNRAGATGAIATQYVYDQDADGYHLLFGAENPALYGVLGLSERDFKEFYPVSIFGRGVGVIVVPADSKYNTLEELIEDAQANPGQVKMGSTGEGGIVHVVSSMLAAEKEGLQFNMIPFDGEGPGLTALIGNHVDVTIAGHSAAVEYENAGKVKVLAVVNDTPIEELPDAPALVEIYPEYEKYLPWGPFYGVWVKQETPDQIKQQLVDAFQLAQEDENFQSLLHQLGAIPMGVYGAEAQEFLNQWQSTTAWVLHDAGVTEVSPEELGIPRVE